MSTLMTPTAAHAVSTPDAHQALVDLCAGWLTPSPADYTLTPPDEVPEPFHSLLVHHRHMTVVLGEHYHQPVHLQVQRSGVSGGAYRRRITLTAGPAGPFTELGIVRLHLQFLPPDARDEILAQLCPLGMILIRHHILRRVVPHYYVRFSASSPIIQLFNLPVSPIVYGRIGTIFCNEQPAIELLEIATGTHPQLAT